ncbi:MAG: hypothetical protein ABI581_17445 [Sediminibacterium sp.]
MNDLIYGYEQMIKHADRISHLLPSGFVKQLKWGYEEALALKVKFAMPEILLFLIGVC